MSDDRWRVEVGDCLAVLERMPADSVDAVVTDPPYGLSRAPDIAEVLTHWLAGDDYVHRGGGFMGQSWDSFVPGPATWREAYRVLKPGGHLLAFFGTRTYDMGVIALRLAGFEVRDRVLTLSGQELGAELDWLYGAGWPKSRDIGKAIDAAAGAQREVVGTKLGQPGYSLTENRDDRTAYGAFTNAEAEVEVTAPATPEAEQWEGWGTALKPAHEPIVVARKPFRGTVEAQVLATGTGALNIDACRVRMNGEQLKHDGSDPGRRRGVVGDEMQASSGRRDPDHNAAAQAASIARANALGRWPANVCLVHAAGCERVGERVVRGDARAGTDRVGAGRSWLKDAGPLPAGPVVGDELVEVWQCAPGCPVGILDEQSGELSSGDPTAVGDPARRNGQNAYMGETRTEGTPIVGYGDRGGASRFFYSGKAGPAERDAGLEDLPEQLKPTWSSGEANPGTFQSDGTRDRARNVHPTVKPIDLMRWLVRLVAPRGAVVLDPFAGSGSTGCAAALEGVRFVGIERDPAFARIARARMTFWASFPVGTPTERILAQVAGRRRQAEEAQERRRELASAGQLDLLAGGGQTDE